MTGQPLIQTVFFDYGGVIANDQRLNILDQLLLQLNLNPSEARSGNQRYDRLKRGQLMIDDFWTELADQYHLSIPSNFRSIIQDQSCLQIEPAVMTLIADIKNQGYQVAVLSNVIEPTMKLIDQAGGYDLFDQRILSCQVGHAKPDPEIYQLALTKTKATAAQSLFIDDKENNLQVARQLGWQTILAQNPTQIVADIRHRLKL